MKAKLLIISSVIISALFFSGCASRSLKEASTSFKVSNAMGKSIELTLPKNLDATELKVTVDPTTGQYSLEAKTLKADASTVIESASAAQADAISKLTDTVRTLVPLALPLKPQP